MILLFFAFIIALVWYYINQTFRDEISKEAIIPGLKAILLIFIAVLVLVDAHMFFETDRLIAASTINGSCVSYVGSDIVFPNATSTLIGTYLSGNAASLDFEDDGQVYTIIEVAASPGAQLEVNYTDVTSFTSFYFKGQAEGAYEVNFLDATSGDWDTLYAFSNTSGGMVENHVYLNGTPYINGSNVSIRINQTDAGNVSHRLVMDWLVLDQTTTYTAYCSDTEDTMYIFIYHEMETEIMMLLLSMLPYMAMAAGAFISIQILLLMKWYVDGRKQPRAPRR